MRTGRFLLFALLVLVVAPSGLEAQRGRRIGEPAYRNPFSLEPYGGALRDAYDLSDSQTALLLGLRLGYSLGSRVRLLANLGYARAADVAFTAAPAVPYDNVWVLTTAGAEFDVIPGRTSASLGAEAGLGWRRTELGDGPVPPPAEDLSSDGFARYEVLAPAVTLRHALGSRAVVRLSLQDYMFDVFEGPTEHSLALTLGIAFR